MKKDNESYLSRRTKLISFIAIIAVIGGIFGIVNSLPLYTLSLSLQQGGIISEADKTVIQEVQPDTPASQAGLQKGDSIISVNGKKVLKTDDFINLTNNNKGEEVVIVVSREGTEQTTRLIPRTNPPAGQGKVGIVITNKGEVIQQPALKIIPQVVIQSYLGTEQRPFLSNLPIPDLNGSYTYHDKYYFRVQYLAIGILGIIIGIGLWKLKKWAMYLYIGCIGLGIILALPLLLNPKNYAPFEPSLLWIKNSLDILDMITMMVCLSLQGLLVLYLYKKRELFK